MSDSLSHTITVPQCIESKAIILLPLWFQVNTPADLGRECNCVYADQVALHISTGCDSTAGIVITSVSHGWMCSWRHLLLWELPQRWLRTRRLCVWGQTPPVARLSERTFELVLHRTHPQSLALWCYRKCQHWHTDTSLFCIGICICVVTFSDHGLSQQSQMGQEKKKNAIR